VLEELTTLLPIGWCLLLSTAYYPCSIPQPYAFVKSKVSLAYKKNLSLEKII
jgi:hypothetical protein